MSSDPRQIELDNYRQELRKINEFITQWQPVAYNNQTPRNEAAMAYARQQMENVQNQIVRLEQSLRLSPGTSVSSYTTTPTSYTIATSGITYPKPSRINCDQWDLTAKIMKDDPPTDITSKFKEIKDALIQAIVNATKDETKIQDNIVEFEKVETKLNTIINDAKYKIVLQGAKVAEQCDKKLNDDIIKKLITLERVVNLYKEYIESRKKANTKLNNIEAERMIYTVKGAFASLDDPLQLRWYHWLVN